ncbi:MAG: hypothetical protein OQK82_04435 [Candidatus Pacearchaeota archaeon]|nr:hypothetical protein [Candidatus Pacearchaeota archaeon]
MNAEGYSPNKKKLYYFSIDELLKNAKRNTQEDWDRINDTKRNPESYNANAQQGTQQNWGMINKAYNKKINTPVPPVKTKKTLVVVGFRKKGDKGFTKNSHGEKK